MAAETSGGTELPPLSYPFDARHESALAMWAAGWSACADWLLPLLDRANADADRYWSAAFAPSTKPKFGPTSQERRQATAELQEQRAREWQQVRG